MLDSRRPSLPRTLPGNRPARVMVGVFAVGFGLSLMPHPAMAQGTDHTGALEAGSPQGSREVEQPETSDQPRKVPGTNLLMGGDDDHDSPCLDGGANAYKSFGPRAFDRRGINGGRPRSSRCR